MILMTFNSYKNTKMLEKEIINKTAKFVKTKLEKEGSGHDWWHIHRVNKNAIQIAQKEKGDLFVIQLAALLHDIQDWKFSKNNDENIGAQIAYDWLKKINVSEQISIHIYSIIKNISFKGANVENSIKSLEGKIVQDADRLDAIGAVGIARTFAYGGFKKREIYNPNIKPALHNNFQDYKKNQSPTINHFYEKLLLLKEKMNTKTGKLLAEKRHQFMLQFLNQFFKEIEE